MTRPHLVFLGHGAERTGPPILLGHLVAGLAAADRYDLTVITARSGPLEAAYAASSARTIAVSPTREPLGRVSSALRQVGAERVAVNLQQQRRRQVVHRAAPADLVYVNGATPPTADLLEALHPDASVPVLLHVHELDIGLRHNLDERRRRALFERADHLIAASDAVARLLVEGHGVAADRVTTCAEFVDVAALRPLPAADARARLGVPDEALVVGSVGLPDWRKDPDHLLRIVHGMERDHARPLPWVIWIGGDPASDDGRRVADETRRLGLDDRFRHVAHQDQPDHLLHALDVFALSAREDAMPLAALEAAAVGVPIVCFRTGGIAGLCDLGAGIAVDYPDSVAFGAALGLLLAEPTERRARGAAARQIVLADHDLAVGVERIRAAIEAMLARGPR